jgi:hypothetical protein
MGNLPADIEQQLASMSEGDFNAFIARVRAPDTTEQLRTALAKHISGDQLEAVLKVANTAAFVDEHGAVDESKVSQSLSGMFGVVPDGGPPHQDFGQNTPRPPQPGPGERGAAEAARRFGGQQPNTPRTGRGAGGAAEAAKRFGPKEQR